MKLNRLMEELKEALEKNKYLVRGLKEGKVEVVVRTKPKLTVYFRKKPKRKLSWQHALMLGIYSSTRGVRGKKEDLPLSAYIAKKAFEKITPEEKARLKKLFGVKEKKYEYISVNEKLLERLARYIKKKTTQRISL